METVDGTWYFSEKLCAALFSVLFYLYQKKDSATSAGAALKHLLI